MKYPVGIQSFDKIIEDCYVYVDKTDVECPLPMIYQSGYLTIKGYERDDDMFRLPWHGLLLRRNALL